MNVTGVNINTCWVCSILQSQIYIKDNKRWRKSRSL